MRNLCLFVTRKEYITDTDAYIYQANIKILFSEDIGHLHYKVFNRYLSVDNVNGAIDWHETIINKRFDSAVRIYFYRSLNEGYYLHLSRDIVIDTFLNSANIEIDLYNVCINIRANIDTETKHPLRWILTGETPTINKLKFDSLITYYV